MWGGRAGPQNASHKYGVIPSRHSGETEVLLKEFPPDNHSSHTEEVNVKMITPCELQQLEGKHEDLAEIKIAWVCDTQDGGK